MSDASDVVRRLSNTGHLFVPVVRLALPRPRDSPALPRPPVSPSVDLGSREGRLCFFFPASVPFSPPPLRASLCAGQPARFWQLFAVLCFLGGVLLGGIFPPPPAACSARPAGVALKLLPSSLLDCHAMFAARHFASQILEIGCNLVISSACCNDPRSSSGFRQRANAVLIATRRRLSRVSQCVHH